MSLRLKMRHVGYAAGLVVLMAYQNCAQAPSSSENSSKQSYQSGLPFAFKAQIDTLSYMSCSDIETAPNQRAFFTFRAGAYHNSTGGLGVTDAFLDATKYYTNTDRANSLARSERNTNALINFSLRSKSDYQTARSSGDQGLAEIGIFLPTLESEEIAGPLGSLSSGVLMNYFPGSAEQRLMETSLSFMKTEGDAEDVRAGLGNGDTVLTMGFTASSDPADMTLRGPASFDTSLTGEEDQITKSVYGLGFKVGFSLANDGFFKQTSGISRVLSTSSGVREISLETGAAGGNWTCPSTFRFLIVRPKDVVAGKATCIAGPDTYQDATQKNNLRAIRRVLRPEDWYVDVVNRCVIPKEIAGDYCYGANIGTRTIQYYNAACTNGNTTACPHFVSVCVRQ